MKRSNAITILKSQKEKLINSSIKDRIWIIQTSNYIKSFLGEQSDEYRFIINILSFNPSTPTKDGRKDNIQMIMDFIDNCIEIIKNKGLYKPPYKNFLQKINNAWLIAIITGIISVSFFAGKFTSDLKNVELKQELKSIKDSLTLSTAPPSNNISNNDTTKNNKSKK